jgi:murein DD-endopeptidase MepM/ murein hydrolase activator NlpD
MCMKLKLTEGQLSKLIVTLDEQETPKPKDSDFMTNLEKEAPNLAAFAKFMRNPIGSAVEKLTGNSEISSSGGEGTFANNIPPGTELMNPLGNKTKITSGFGPRNIGGRATKNHKGVDLPAVSGSPVYAPADGRVVAARDTTPNGCGGYVQLDHMSIGLKTKYCHLKKWLVSQGQEVKKGQLIGYSGGASNDPYKGNSMGAHLHYEVLNSASIAMNPKKVHSDMV